MYRGFQLDLRGQSPEQHTFITELLNFSNQGKALKEVNESIIKKTLDSFFLSNGSIDGSKMQTNWFPQIKADVFISHSHQDEELTLGLAGWLEKHFGLKAFVDSAVWGYSDYLLQKIDDKYCLQEKEEKGLYSYSYKKRNRSTSHVHMMLSVALTRMIDSTECLFFLNTPQSVSPNLSIANQETTSSPWIYSEIVMSRLVMKKQKGHGIQFRRANESKPDLKVEYPLLMDHLKKLTSKDLQERKRRCQDYSSRHIKALDFLYELNPQ